MATSKADIMTRNTRFKNFLTTHGKGNDQVNIPLTELKTLLNAIDNWNLRIDVTPENKITKIGIINGLINATNKVNSYLVGVNNANQIIIGGGGTLESPPHYK